MLTRGSPSRSRSPSEDESPGDSSRRGPRVSIRLPGHQGTLMARLARSSEVELSTRDNADDRSRVLPPSSAYAPRVHAPDHSLRSRCRTVLPHRLVLFEKIGPGLHCCYWCGRAVLWQAPFIPAPFVYFTDARGRHFADIERTAEAREGIELVVDHWNGNPRDNRPENLVPSCRACNAERGWAGNPRVFGQQTLERVFGQVVATVRDRVRERLDVPREIKRRARMRPMSLQTAASPERRPLARGPPTNFPRWKATLR